MAVGAIVFFVFSFCGIIKKNRQNKEKVVLRMATSTEAMNKAMFMTAMARHQRWLANKAEGYRFVVYNADLRDVPLSSWVLEENFSLAYALFDNVDFSGADLSKLDMRYLSAEGCQFDGIDGHELRLESAFLRKTSWIGAKLTEADFRYAALENAFFEEADLRFAKGLDRRMPYGGHYMTAFPKEAMQESDVARLLTMPTFDQDRRKRTILWEDDQKNLSIDHRMGFVVGTMAWWEKVLYQRPDLRQQVVLCDVHLPAGSQLVMPLGSDGDFRASSLLIDRIRWEPVV